MIEVPQTAIDLAKRFEGFERKVRHGVEITAVPYICPAGFWTIGYGHLCDSKHPPISEAEAEVYLARDLQSALAATLRYCPVLATEPEGLGLDEVVDSGVQRLAGEAAPDICSSSFLRRSSLRMPEEERSRRSSLRN